MGSEVGKMVGRTAESEVGNVVGSEVGNVAESEAGRTVGKMAGKMVERMEGRKVGKTAGNAGSRWRKTPPCRRRWPATPRSASTHTAHFGRVCWYRRRRRQQ